MAKRKRTPVTILLMYPGHRPQAIFWSKKDSWRYLARIYDTIREVIPDQGYDSGLRPLKLLVTYDNYSRRFDTHKILHVECKMKGSDTTHVMTARMYALL